MKNVTYIQVRDSHATLAQLAQNFYDNPSKKLKLIGITGTNGKTTTATLLFNLFRSLGYHAALISTIENKIDNKVFPTTHTSPDPVSLAQFLSLAVSKNCSHAFMECSSHAIDQKRIHSMVFAGGVFTNLSHDHLDYHKTFKAYAKAKKRLFDILPKKSFALTNLDDKRGLYMVSDTQAKKFSYSIKNDSDFQGIVQSQSLTGLTVVVDKKQINTNVIGIFNAYNILAIYAAAKILKIPQNKLISCLEKMKTPKGRLEFVTSPDGIYGIVDYAHTPDALENVLKTLDKVRNKNSKIITVIGCGGNRDTTKRPLMAKIACTFSDCVIFTADNSRTEDTKKIIADMIVGVIVKNFECIENRAKAISKACAQAVPGDIVLIAGKGHENYQIFKNKTVYFSDFEELVRNFKIGKT